jgi:3-oxoacyl-[acyl-carrier-protein] synthase-3
LFFQDGKTVFKYAVSKMAEVSDIILERNHLDKDKINWLAAHQANKRIIDATASQVSVCLKRKS